MEWTGVEWTGVGWSVGTRDNIMDNVESSEGGVGCKLLFAVVYSVNLQFVA